VCAPLLPLPQADSIALLRPTNIVSLQPRCFDPATHEREEETVIDESGRRRVRLADNAVIRCACVLGVALCVCVCVCMRVLEVPVRACVCMRVYAQPSWCGSLTMPLSGVRVCWECPCVRVRTRTCVCPM